MAKQKAPVALTGGAGFNFEDYVAARFLIDMLASLCSFGKDFGQVTKVDWQTRDSGRLLDDLRVTLASANCNHTAELSIKSNRQFTSAGFPENFVEAVWEQWHTDSTVFEKDKDLLVLVAGTVANDVAETWNRLLREAIATEPDRLLSRLQEPDSSEGSQSSDTARAILDSLHCPERLKDKGASSPTETVAVLRRTRFLDYDFQSALSRDEARAVVDCRDRIRSGDEAEGQRLWSFLVSLAKEQRELGGTLDLTNLLGRLRGEFDLQAHRDYRRDWQVLEEVTADFLADIRTDVAGLTSVDRDDEIRDIFEFLSRVRVCFAAGESGCGKSALAKILGEKNYDSVVAIPPDAFESGRKRDLQHRLGISHSLVDILGAGRRHCLLILDSLERSTESGVQLIGQMLSELQDVRYEHVHVLAIVQFDAASRILGRLVESGMHRDLLEIFPIETPSDDSLRALRASIPSVPWVTLHQDMHPLLRNLKILDWVARVSQAGAMLDPSRVTDLPSLIDYLWQRWVEPDDNGIAYSGLLKKLAVVEASSLSHGVPLTEFEHNEQKSLASLVSLELLHRRKERIQFSHDLLGDWARLKVLIGEDPTLTDAGLARASAARWHRAVRLYGRWILNRLARSWEE